MKAVRQKTKSYTIIASLCILCLILYINHTISNSRKPLKCHTSRLLYDGLSRLNPSERIVSIKQACRNYPDLRSYVPSYHMRNSRLERPAYLVNRSRSFLYCPVPKCGWSSWKNIFFDAFTPINDNKSRMAYFDNGTGWGTQWNIVGLSPHTLYEGLTGNLNLLNHKMIFIRNPYDRLVSAYRDKVLRNNASYVRRHGRPCKWDGEQIPSFPQFVECIINNVKSNMWLGKSSFDAGEVLDIHWRPQTLLCNICTMGYNVIGTYENMDKDMRDALDMLNLKTRPVQHNMSTKSDKKKRKLELISYYRQLSGRQLRDLQCVYKYDLELLGYDNHPF